MQTLELEYELSETLYESERTTVYRGRGKQPPHQKVILKCLTASYPSPRELLRMRREFEITRQLQGREFPTMLASKKHFSQRVLVQEDIGGQSLDHMIESRPLGVDTFLDLAISLSRAIAQLHDQGVIHRDINPSNIIYNAETERLQLIDFGLAMRMGWEHTAARVPRHTTGTLSYMSPEQTGRTNRLVDHRADLYSLGATLYELLTGQLPFRSRDPAELIYLHLTHRPTAPSELLPQLPAQLSRIIMKLLSKAPEGRYQSARGVYADLEKCRRQWRERGIVVDFDLGQHDMWATLRISQHLYGRDEELRRLRQALRRTRPGERQLTLITGDPGVGKTALVDEVGAPLTGRNGWFVSGKFDPQLQGIPYTALGSAMGELITRLLGRSEASLSQWRRRIKAVLEDDGALIASVVPELDTLLQTTWTDSRVEAEEAKHRFRHAFRRFISVFCTDDRPLIIFLDDLQWIDEASLELMEVLLTDAEVGPLHIIGAYRDGEVGPDHRLVSLLDRLRQAGETVETIALGALDGEAVKNLVADTLHCERQVAAPLAGLLHKKTSGNPYFIHQFLANLVATEVLWFEPEQGEWNWDLRGIQALPAAENVVDILSQRMVQLDADARRVVTHAALLGTRFSLNLLAMICELSEAQTYRYLEPAIELGVIVPVEEARLVDPDDPDSAAVVPELVFSHDRVREAAAQLVEEAAREALHLRVGRRLASQLRPDASSEMLFLVVQHLNQGAALIDDDSQCQELVRLNLRAGMEALDAQAFAAASRYLAVADEFLPDHAWQSDPELARQVHLQRGRAESLRGGFEVAARTLQRALENLDDPVERASFQCILIEQLTRQSDFHGAAEVAQSALEALGESLSVADFDAQLGDALIAVEERLAGRSLDVVRGLDVDDDKRAGAALRVLAALQPAAGLIDLRFLLLVGLKAMVITLDIGVHPASVVGLSVYGTALCTMNEVHRGYDAGHLALELARQFDRQSDISHVAFMVGAMIFPWTRPLRQSQPLFEEGQRAGLRSGNFIFAGFNAMLKLVYGYFQGRRLDDCLRHADDAVELSAHTGNIASVELASAARLVIRNLAGYTASVSAFEDERYESAESFLKQCEANANHPALATFEIARAQTEYLYGDFAKAHRRLRARRERLDDLVGTFETGRFPFLYAMATAQICMEMEPHERADLRREVVELRDQLAGYAENGEANFLHKRLLVDAELARIDADMEAAMKAYDRAIEEASREGFVHLVALANERAARFWLAWDKEEFALHYLREAIYHYELWQARPKVKMLQEEFDHLLVHPTDAEVTTSGDTTGEAAIDLDSVFQASELIAGQLDVADLLPTLMQVALENAGAQRGTFLIAVNGQLCAAVEGETGTEPTPLDPPQPLDEWSGGPRSVIRYVQRVGEPLVLGRASVDPRFHDDPYINETQARSVLCIPVEESGQLRGILYVENNLADHMFIEERARVLQILAGHIAIAIHKSHLYMSLHQEKERFRQLAENIREVFWLMDWPSREIVYISPAFEAVWGQSMPQTPLSVDQWVEAIADSDRERVADALCTQAARGDYDETYRIVRPSGNERWIRDRGFPIHDTDGNIYRIAGVANDITREHEVAQLKDEFVSVVSHELRTPLTPITGIFSMLTREYSDQLPKEVREMANLGLRNSRRLLNLIDDLLDIQKLSMDQVSFELELLDARQVITDAVELNVPLGDLHEISLTLELHDSPVLIESDSARMLQVMTNLLSNAIKFSNPGDSVTVEVYPVDDRARIGVTDSGPGIPREARELIFEKFTQVDSSLTREHGGTGLGLAIARSLVERMGGTIEVVTEMGQGTTFFIDLPLASRR